MARPRTRYEPEKWGDDFEARVLESYEEGHGDAAIFKMLYKIRGSFSNNLWERWFKDEARFRELITTGRALSREWWERLGREHTVEKFKGDKVNAKLYELNMMNRFGWNKKNETDLNGSLNINFQGGKNGAGPKRKTAKRVGASNKP